VSCGCGGGGPRIWWPLVYGILIVIAGAFVVVKDMFVGYSLSILLPFLLATGVLTVFYIGKKRQQIS
jgi:hypothetical protein